MSGHIPKSFITQIVEVTDIVSLVEGFVKLKKKGKNYLGLCPFCDDGKNPSFTVSPQRNFYHCFKCKTSGNVITFLTSQGYDFVESIEILAKRESLDIPYERSSKKQEDLEPLFRVLASASSFFENSLADASIAKKAQSYIKNDRHISSGTCRRFNVGYAPKSWNALSSHLSSKGFSEELQIKAGLSKRNNKNKELFDVFRDRLMFPIKDRKGRIVGFGGRVMNPEDQPKYLNTGETAVFKKGRELYGLYEALEDRRNLTKIYVVEGYTDVIAMSENGIKNSVATLGIATNQFHVRTLLTWVKEVIFCFDGDSAGRGAAWEALKDVLPEVKDGVEIKFMFLPEDEDPASLLEKESKEDFESRLEECLLLSEYFIERLTLKIGTTSLEEKASLASAAMEHLSSMPESSIKKLLEAEVSKVTGLSKKDIQENSQLIATRKKKETKFISTTQKDKEQKPFEPSGIIAKALASVLTYPELISEVDSTEWIKDLARPEANLLLQVIEYFKNSPKGQVADLLSSLDTDSASIIGSLLSKAPLLEEKNSVAYFHDCLEAMRKSNPILRIKELKEQQTQEKLSEDETFELQQHLLSNLDKLDEEDKVLLRQLSQD